MFQYKTQINKKNINNHNKINKFSKRLSKKLLLEKNLKSN